MRRLRERRAAALVPGDGSSPLPLDEQLAPAVEETIAVLELGGEDLAAAQLTRRYARIIDEARDQAWALRWIGPLLADALGELGATPAARARMKTEKPAPAVPSRLGALRAARVRDRPL
jgi:hypothetical protein